MTTKTIPAGALRFDAGRIEFARAGQTDKGDGRRVPVKLRARSGQPITHHYWGRVVHDMAGFRAVRPKVPLDYCHDAGEVIGYADEFKPSPAGLDVAGALVVFRADDRAAEVIEKSRAGVPFQASIMFDSQTIVVEEVRPGASALVNGYKLAGPAAIIRQWELRGIAVCPYGYDPHTETKLAAGGQATVRVLSPAEAAREAERSKLANVYGAGVAGFAVGLKLPGKRR